MTFKKLFNRIIKEERNSGYFNNFQVIVGEDEGLIPHFHLIGENKLTAIRLDMPYYFLRGNKSYILNSKEKKNLIKWLYSSNINGEETPNKDGNRPNNNWENLKNSWNIMYPSNQITCSRPDYSLLSKNYK